MVVVATNAASYLSACLDSLRSQTLKRIEVLVVDNGSTDAHRRSCARDRGPTIPDSRWCDVRRLGLTASRNAGARLSTMDRFLAFVDAIRHRAAYRLCQFDQLAATDRLGLCGRQRTHGHPGQKASPVVGPR